MTTSAKELRDTLLQLRDLDLKIAELDRELSVGPASLRELQALVGAADEKLKGIDERARVLKAQVRLRENELNGHEQKLQKLKDQSSLVKTQKEFITFRSEISNVQADADKMQSEILKILDAIEVEDKKSDAAKQEKAAAETKMRDAKAKVEGSLGGKRSQREALAAQRKPLLGAMTIEQRDTYERVRGSRGDAVGFLEAGEYCSGCMERLTRNDAFAVQNMSRLVQCKSCNRILVPA
jgi:predicted  nucleic acid-binding Zn-ribbon protein